MILEKYQGCGNDFLIVDGSRTPVINRSSLLELFAWVLQDWMNIISLLWMPVHLR